MITIKHGTTAQWNIEDPILNAGELVLDDTVGELKAGDGVHRFSELRYIGQTWERNDIYDFGDYDATETLDVHPTGHVGHTHTVDDIIGLGNLATQDTISVDEIDATDNYTGIGEGSLYTGTFTPGEGSSEIASRWRPAGTYGSSSFYWLRSMSTYTNSICHGVWNTGLARYNLNASTTGPSGGVLPVLRF